MPIPLSDPDAVVHDGLRSAIESNHSIIERRLEEGRAHSIGHASQLVNMIAYAVAMNSVALYAWKRRRERTAGPPPTALAA